MADETSNLLNNDRLLENNDNLAHVQEDDVEKEFSHVDNGIPIIEQIFSYKGFGRMQYSMFFSFGFYVFAEGFYVLLIPSTLIIFKKVHDIDDLTACVATSLLFISFGLACFFSSILSSKISRMKILLASSIIHIPLAIIFAWVESIESFMVLFVLIGLTLGVSMPILNNTYAEVLGINLRAFALIFVWIFFVFAQLYYPVSMSIFLPDLNPKEFSIIIKVGSCLVSVLLLISTYLYHDSPRNLLVQHDYEEAFKALEKVLGMPLSEKTKDCLKESTKTDVVNQSLCDKSDGSIKTDGNVNNNNSDNSVISANDEARQDTINNEHKDKSIKRQLRKLFDKDIYLRLTILTASLWLINSFIFYGPSLILTLTIERVSEGQKLELESIDTKNEIFTSLFFYSAASLLCILLSAFMAEVSFLGRKNTLIICYTCSSISAVFIVCFPEKFKILAGILSLFASVGFSVIGSFSSELFSTDVRDTAIGLFFFCNRAGAVASQFLFLYLFKVYYLLPYIILIILTFLASVCSYLYPFDTLGRPLDTIK